MKYGPTLSGCVGNACSIEENPFHDPLLVSHIRLTMSLGIQHPPDRIDDQILEFCARLCPDSEPQFVHVKPDARAKLLDCHPNVAAKVKRDGGRHVFGWQISVAPHIFLEAQFHSVWKSPAGRLVDITMEEAGHSRILFLEDPYRSYNGERLANERFPLGPPDMVSRFLELADRSHVILQDLIAAGFRAGDPVFRSRLTPLQQELASIRHELIKDAT